MFQLFTDIMFRLYNLKCQKRIIFDRKYYLINTTKKYDTSYSYNKNNYKKFIK